MTYDVTRKLSQLQDDLMERLDDVFTAYGVYEGMTQAAYEKVIGNVFGSDVEESYRNWLAEGDNG
jgi:nucleoside recognition membrane protein YjiH